MTTSTRDIFESEYLCERGILAREIWTQGRHPVILWPMRKVLVHSYYFPPIGGSGAQRPLKVVRALADLGYDSTVVTGHGATSDRWAPEDATLTAEIPDHIEVHRLSSEEEPPPSREWREFAERWLGLRRRWDIWWVESSFRLGAEVGAEVDLIYVWMQPYASAEVGAALSAALDRPWVADLGDPWALDEMMVYPTAAHRRTALKRMREALETAAAIVMSTPEAVRRLTAAFPEFRDRPVVAIPNGFDAADFADEPPQRDDHKFRIVHAGYLHTALGEQHRRRRLLRRILGGGVRGLDILTRSHVYLVDAINRLLAQDQTLREVLDLHLAGVMTDSDRAVAARCPVTIHGYMTHAESIVLMRTADLLFLPMQNLPPGVRATIVPGKTYEYLASGTPILAAVPDGDARDILEAAGNALLVRPDDVEGIASGIAAGLERFRTGVAPPRPNPNIVADFEYRKLAAGLAGVFDAVLGSETRPSPRNAASALGHSGSTNQP
jgi:glycosyltransferase involved in cell wall biosynthesis